MEKERAKAEAAALADLRGIARNPSLSTINEERSSQISMYESAMSEASGLDDERADVSVSIDGKEISLSLYDTPDISEAEAKQIAEIYAEEISDHILGRRPPSVARGVSWVLGMEGVMGGNNRHVGICHTLS